MTLKHDTTTTSSPGVGTRKRLAVGLLSLLGVGVSAAALGQAIQTFGPPPAGDPSEYTGPIIDTLGDIRDLTDHAHDTIVGSLEGGDPGVNGSLAEDDLDGGGSFDIPTGSPASPMYGAGDFEQRMLRFEEFGPGTLGGSPQANGTFPAPTTGPLPEQDPNSVSASAPLGTALEAFLAEPGLNTAPTLESNTLDHNPWEPQIESFVGRDVITPPAEGRPPGAGWAHQRYDEFTPEVYLKTAQAGARVNGGFRDSKQRHGYSVGEFGPGGLYNTIYDTDLPGGPVLAGTTNGLGIKFHPNMPIQDHKSLWTFDGTLPPKLLIGRYGEGILMRHYNALPIDPSANRGFGLHTMRDRIAGASNRN